MRRSRRPRAPRANSRDAETEKWLAMALRQANRSEEGAQRLERAVNASGHFRVQCSNSRNFCQRATYDEASRL